MMINLVLFVGIPITVVVALVGWRLKFNRGAARQPQVPTRRREDARDWQRRFGGESLPSANFFPPTQNEILETLYILDHMTPRWETGDATSVESIFLNELAVNFPTLRKVGSVFPHVSTDGPEMAQITARREAFRARRAQSNALDQIISNPVAPGEIVPDNALLGRSERGSARTSGNLWPVLLGGAAVLVAAILGATRFFPATVNFKTTAQPDTEALPAAIPTVDTPAPAPMPAVAGAVAEATPPPSPTPTTQIVGAKPVPVPRATPSQATLALERQIAASKQRAVSKYPELAVEGSEINLRFVFRYKNLVQENSPRLRDPNWPEQLVEECAAAAGTTTKRNGFTRVLGTPR